MEQTHLVWEWSRFTSYHGKNLCEKNRQQNPTVLHRWWDKISHGPKTFLCLSWKFSKGSNLVQEVNWMMNYFPLSQTLCRDLQTDKMSLFGTPFAVLGMTFLLSPRHLPFSTLPVSEMELTWNDRWCLPVLTKSSFHFLFLVLAVLGWVLKGERIKMHFFTYWDVFYSWFYFISTFHTIIQFRVRYFHLCTWEDDIKVFLQSLSYDALVFQIITYLFQFFFEIITIIVKAFWAT